MDNCLLAFKHLLIALNIKYTKRYYESALESHPDYPSLLAVSDTLEKYKIDNVAVKVDDQKLKELPRPSLVQVSVLGEDLFYVLMDFSDKGVVYQDDKNKATKVSKEEFLKIWTGVCLIMEISENSGEPGIKEALAKKRTTNLLAGITTICLISALTFTLSMFPKTLSSFFIITYTLLKLLGLAVGVMLLWYEVDKYNPVLQSFCSGGKKADCDSVLSSKYANLFGGNISVSTLVFAYFFGSLGLLLFEGFSSASLSILGLFSFATVLGVLASLYYQALVIKQWCKFCIITQVLLTSEIITAFLGDFYKQPLAFATIPVLIALLLIPIIAWKRIKPLLENEKETLVYQKGLKKIKSNPDVLNALLAKTKKIGTNPEGLGISIQKESARYNVIKVCNPYCGPCSKAHSVLEELINDEKINLQILFTASASDTDRRAKPVRHFLAIDSAGNSLKTQEALDGWYHSEVKDYDLFANKFPLNELLEQQDDKINAMDEWCRAQMISGTPTIFINGHEMPKEYSVEDLKDVLV